MIFPRRPLSEPQCVALILQQLVDVVPLDDSLARTIAGLRVGSIAADGLLESVPDLVAGVSDVTVVLTSYEWQSTEFLDRFLMTMAINGVRIVCSLIDPDDFLRGAASMGVTVSVIDDADLALRPEELATIVRECGIEPSHALVDRILDLTGGHATLSGGMVQHLGGASSVTVASGGRVDVTYVSPRASSTGMPASGPAHASATGSDDLLLIDPGTLTSGVAREVAGLLGFQRSELDALAGTRQGRSPFLRACRVLSRMTGVNVDGMVMVMPGLGLQHQTRRLVDSGYGRYEVGGDGHLEFVWRTGVRLMLVENLSLAGDDAACKLFDSIATRYADDGRLRDFARSIYDCGDAIALDRMTERYFLELTWELLPAGFAGTGLTPPRGTSPRQTPHLVILAALSRLWSGSLGEHDRMMVETAVQELVDRITHRLPGVSQAGGDGSGAVGAVGPAVPATSSVAAHAASPRSPRLLRLPLPTSAAASAAAAAIERSGSSADDGSGVVAALLCGVFLAGRWGMMPSLESTAIGYVQGAAREGCLRSRSESRLGVEIGAFSLMRLRFMMAATALRVSQRGMHARNPGVQSLVVECENLLEAISGEKAVLRDCEGLVGSDYVDDLSRRVPPLAGPIAALLSAGSVWRLVDAGDVVAAADRAEVIMTGHPDLMEYPLVGWSAMVAPLLAGRFRRAIEVRESRREVGADWSQPRMGLASFFDALTDLRGMWERLPRAVEQALAIMDVDARSRSNPWYAVLGPFFRSSEDGEDHDSTAGDATWDAVIDVCRDEPVRLRVIAGMLAVARLLRVGRTESADSLCVRVLGMGVARDVAAALHIVSASDAKRILGLPAMGSALEGTPDLAEAVSKRDGCPYVLPDIAVGGGEVLSDAQMAVLRLVAQGMSNAEVALQLHVSVNTVKSHLRHVFTELGVTNRKDAGRRAGEFGLL